MFQPMLWKTGKEFKNSHIMEEKGKISRQQADFIVEITGEYLKSKFPNQRLIAPKLTEFEIYLLLRLFEIEMQK